MNNRFTRYFKTFDRGAELFVGTAIESSKAKMIIIPEVGNYRYVKGEGMASVAISLSEISRPVLAKHIKKVKVLSRKNESQKSQFKS